MNPFVTLPILVLLCLLVQESLGFSSSSIPTQPAVAAATTTTSSTKDVVTTVAVTGATGRTGRYVVAELLERGVNRVIAVVRDVPKAKELFAGSYTPAATADHRLDIVECNLADTQSIHAVFGGSTDVDSIDATIWCATGFADAAPEETGLLAKAKVLLGLGDATTKNKSKAPQQSIDLVGLPAIAETLLAKKKEKSGGTAAGELPNVVMCSSSGVTRPIWNEDKKQKFAGAADIPIVRLNPFSILDRKRESEEELRKSGVNYCIVRPCGLNDDWPSGSRPIFSQGDVAVGRIHRKDVASLLVDMLSTPEATGKTFEVVGLAGYPAPDSIAPAVGRLTKDADTIEPSEDILFATYSTMQQLLPGEKQDSAALAMGQTYEQLDKGETGRLGERGRENAESAAPKPTS